VFLISFECTLNSRASIYLSFYNVSIVTASCMHHYQRLW